MTPWRRPCKRDAAGRKHRPDRKTIVGHRWTLTVMNEALVGWWAGPLGGTFGEHRIDPSPGGAEHSPSTALRLPHVRCAGWFVSTLAILWALGAAPRLASLSPSLWTHGFAWGCGNQICFNVNHTTCHPHLAWRYHVLCSFIVVSWMPNLTQLV